jgi:hypothetical protein
MSDLNQPQQIWSHKDRRRLLLQPMMSLTQSPALTEQVVNNQQRELLVTWTI